MQLPYETPPTVRDPQMIWLQTLLAGAILGIVAAVLFSAWHYVHLTSRLESVPRRRSIDAAFPYVMIAQAAINWMSAWMLTIRSPLYEPVLDHRTFERLDRVRIFLLRLIVSALFVIWSLRMWGLIGPQRLTVNTPTFAIAMSAGEVAAFLLLWLHVRRLSTRIGLRGLAWRAVVVLIVTGSARVLLIQVLAAELGSRWPFTFDQNNVALSVIVLTGVMAMLAMGRFSWALFRQLRKSGRHGSAAGIA